MLLNDPTNPARRSVRFSATRDFAEIDPTTAADPRTVGATLEVFGEGAGDGSSGVIVLDPSFWKGLGRPPGTKGYRYLRFQRIDRDQEAGVQDRRQGRIAHVHRTRHHLAVPDHAAAGAGDGAVHGGQRRLLRGVHHLRPQHGGQGDGQAHRRAARPARPSVRQRHRRRREGCDDDNTTDGDGCSAACRLESSVGAVRRIPGGPGTRITWVRVAAGLTKSAARDRAASRPQPPLRRRAGRDDPHHQERHPAADRVPRHQHRRRHLVGR